MQSNSSDEPDNLALAWSSYNDNFTTGIDPETGKNISLVGRWFKNYWDYANRTMMNVIKGHPPEEDPRLTSQ